MELVRPTELGSEPLDFDHITQHGGCIPGDTLKSDRLTFSEVGCGPLHGLGDLLKAAGRGAKGVGKGGVVAHRIQDP